MPNLHGLNQTTPMLGKNGDSGAEQEQPALV
jgi:hypothetical protein